MTLGRRRWRPLLEHRQWRGARRRQCQQCRRDRGLRVRDIWETVRLPASRSPRPQRQRRLTPRMLLPGCRFRRATCDSRRSHLRQPVGGGDGGCGGHGGCGHESLRRAPGPAVTRPVRMSSGAATRPSSAISLSAEDFPGTWRVVADNISTGLREVRDSLWKPDYLRACRKYAPALRLSDLQPAEAGIPAQSWWCTPPGSPGRSARRTSTPRAPTVNPRPDVRPRGRGWPRRAVPAR